MCHVHTPLRPSTGSSFNPLLEFKTVRGLYDLNQFHLERLHRASEEPYAKKLDFVIAWVGNLSNSNSTFLKFKKLCRSIGINKSKIRVKDILALDRDRISSIVNAGYAFLLSKLQLCFRALGLCGADGPFMSIRFS